MSKLTIRKNRTVALACSVFVLALAVVLPAGCSKAEIGGNPTDAAEKGKHPVTFTSVMQGQMATELAATRATANNSWEGGEEVAVEIAGVVKPYTAASDGTLTATNSTDPTPWYWTTATPSLTARAWYPYSAARPTTFTVKPVQSGNGYQQSDMVYAPATTITYRNPKLEFKHLPARVVVNLQAGDGFTAEQVRGAAISIHSQSYESGAISIADEGLATEAWSVAQIAPGRGAIYPCNPLADKDIKTGYQQAVQALLVPQQMKDKAFIRVTIGGKRHTYTPTADDDANLLAGKQYIYNATLSKAGLTVTSEIKEWGAGEAIAPGNAQGVDFVRYTASDLKIGDYYYSDGNYSDGGLRCRYANGSIELVEGDKPAPTAGKTVIGIVFQTNPARIGTKEKEVLAAKGTATPHGLVMAINNAGPEVYWCNTPQAEAIPYANTRAACYNDINGLSHTNTIKQKTIANYPAFDRADKYTPAAPADKSTGWFLPSIGQWWDIMQHLGGAPILATFAEQTGGGQTSPPGQFMWENQDHFVSNLNDWTSTINGSANFSTGQRFWSSTQYNEGAYAARVLEITDAAAGSLEISWYGKKVGQNRLHVRPILAF